MKNQQSGKGSFLKVYALVSAVLILALVGTAICLGVAVHRVDNRVSKLESKVNQPGSTYNPIQMCSPPNKHGDRAC